MGVIGIARQYGAGASVIGRRVAERLGYQLVDRAMLDEVARRANVSVRRVADIEKLAGETFLSFLTEVITKTPAFQVPGIKSDFDEKKYLLFLRKAITELAGRGRAVIIGRGCQFVLRNNPTAVRVYLVADEKDRIRNLMNYYDVDREKAKAIARRRETRRLAFLRKFEKGSPDDPLLYHLVINTSHVDFDRATDFICSMASEMEQNNNAV